jgi:apolipoprotein N-acyltransferase
MGGVVGIVGGLIDVFAVIFGMMWLTISVLPTLGLSLLAVPFLLPILVVISLLGIMMLIMISLGWKTLE